MTPYRAGLRSPAGEDKRLARAEAQKLRTAAHARGPGRARRVAAHALTNMGPLAEMGMVSGYLPIGSELDPLPLMLVLHGCGVKLCVPVVETPAAPLKFRPWWPGIRTRRGRFGVLEPEEGAFVSPDHLLVPLLAFDASGRRLGYGGGFYDRTIAALRQSQGARAFGLAYAAQEMPEVPSEPTDVPLDAIFTEDGVVQPPLGAR